MLATVAFGVLAASVPDGLLERTRKADKADIADNGPLAAPSLDSVPLYGPEPLDWSMVKRLGPPEEAVHATPRNVHDDPWVDRNAISHPLEVASAYAMHRLLEFGRRLMGVQVAALDKEQPAPIDATAQSPQAGPGTFRFPFIRTPAAKAAIEGALTGSKDGLAALQSYLDEVIGNDSVIMRRAEYLIRNLRDAQPEADPSMILTGANRIADAAAKSAATGYVVPVVEDPGFKLGGTHTGWDLGPAKKNAYLGFERVGADSGKLVGSQRRLASLPMGDTIFADGIQNLQGFVSGLPKGDYRVYVIAREPGDRLLDAEPFGEHYRANGAEERIQPLGPGGPHYVARLNPSGIARETREPAADVMTSIHAVGAPKGVMLVGRAHVEGDTLRLAFDGPKGPADHETFAEDYDGKIIFRAVTAGYRNTLGSYTVSRDGKIGDVTIHFADATEVGWGGKLVPDKSTSPLRVKAGERVGFFIISDGYNKNDHYRGIDLSVGHFEFRNADGSPATLHSVNPLLWYVAPDGTERRILGRKYHTAAGTDGLGYALNPDGIAHTVRTVNVDRGELTLGFEDMYRGGDRDFDDSVFTVDIGRSNALVLDPHVSGGTVAVSTHTWDSSYVAALVAEPTTPFDINHLKDLIAQLLNDITPAAGLVKFAAVDSPGPFHSTNNHGRRTRLPDHRYLGGFGFAGGGNGASGDGDGTGGDGDGTGGDGDGDGDGDGTGGDGDGDGTGGDGDGDGTGGDGDGDGTGGDGDGDGTGGDGDGDGTGGDGDGDGTGGDGDGDGTGGDGDGDGTGGDGDGDGTGGDGDGDGTGGDGDGDGTGGDGDGDGDGTGGDGDGDGTGGDGDGGTGDSGHVLIADAGGTYEVDLGSLFVLDGCASTFDSVYLCGLDLSQFSVAWLLGDQVIGTDIRLTNISTGTGTSFPSYGNYDVSLSITWLGDPAISDTDTALVSIGGSGGGGVPIPEPATLMVFGTGLFAIGIIGWRRRRHRIRGPDSLGAVEGRRTRL